MALHVPGDMEHGRDHDNLRFHKEDKTTRRRGDRVIDDEEKLPPSEPAPAAKLKFPQGTHQ